MKGARTYVVALRFLFLTLLISFSFVTSPFAQESSSDEFEGRKLFPTVKWIGLDDLYAKRGDVIIVDVRSKYEYNTLHIKSALNIALGSKTFAEELTKLTTANPRKTIVFYCNGRTCMKSYEAVVEAHKLKLTNVLAYDAGIFDWAKKYPDESVLLGTSPLDTSRLIPRDNFNKHLLTPKEFDQRIGSGAIVLDVRDTYQQEATALFPVIQRSVPLDNAALKQYIDQAKREGKTLLIYDATGHQVAWLQYYLEAERVPSYYFMKGGAKDYYTMMLKEMSAKSKESR